MVKCELCGLELKTTQALAGHKQFKHELAGRYAKAYELAESVELLEKKKAEREQSVSDLAQIKQQVEEIEKEKTEKQAELMQLQQLAQVKANEVARVLRQQLIQAGWYPLQEMDASSLVLLLFLRWASTNKI